MDFLEGLKCKSALLKGLESFFGSRPSGVSGLYPHIGPGEGHDPLG